MKDSRKIAVGSGVVVAALAMTLLLAGCGRHEDEWKTLTGSPQQGEAASQPAAQPTPPATAPGDPNEKNLRGCLSGANEQFTLVEERTGTVYRLGAPESAEAKPNSREVFELMKLNAGRVVQVDGARKDSPGQGVPDFEVENVQTIADRCPANLSGATNELNRPPAAKVGMKMSSPTQPLRGSMRETTPPSTVRPINPAK